MVERALSSDRLDGPDGVVLRRPTESDHRRLARLVDQWWGERGRGRLPRLWFRDFASTSWLAESADGRPVGVLAGYRSQDRPEEAAVHLVAVAPGWRRRGLGRRLVETFIDQVAAVGVERVTAVAWPGNPGAMAFLRAVDFSPVDHGSRGQRLYGTPAIADYDGEGEDRAVFVREAGRQPPP